MNTFLSRWGSWFESSHLLFILKKSPTSGFYNSRALPIIKRINPTLLTSGLIYNISKKGISTNCRLNVSFVYQVTLKTGDKIGAGTDSNIYMRMIGSLGSTNEIMLKTEKKQLERGSLDHYNIALEDVGPLKKIIIRHDNTGFAPGWFLDWVSIRDGKGKKYNFRCENWLVKGDAYGNIKLLKEDRYVDISVPDGNRDIEMEVDGDTITDLNGLIPEGKKTVAKGTMEDVMTSNRLDDKILEDLRDLEKLESTIKRVNSAYERNAKSNQVDDDQDLSREQKFTIFNVLEDEVSDQQSRKHAMSLSSPAVRNLLDTHDIDMVKVQSTGHHSRILKDDILAYIAKENITKNKFTVDMLHPVMVQQQFQSSVNIPPTEHTYVDHTTNADKKMLNHKLKMSKLQVPHLCMSVVCPIVNFNNFSSILENRFQNLARNIILIHILSKALLNTDKSSVDNNESIDVLVTHNGRSVLLKGCNGSEVESIYQQYKDFNENIESVVIPPYGLNILDTDDVCQLSSILRVGQVLSLNVSGPKLELDGDGKLSKSVTLVISCDSRVISEVTCASLLVNCKNFLTDPNLLGLEL